MPSQLAPLTFPNNLTLSTETLGAQRCQLLKGITIKFAFDDLGCKGLYHTGLRNFNMQHPRANWLFPTAVLRSE